MQNKATCSYVEKSHEIQFFIKQKGKDPIYHVFHTVCIEKWEGGCPTCHDLNAQEELNKIITIRGNPKN